MSQQLKCPGCDRPYSIDDRTGRPYEDACFKCDAALPALDLADPATELALLATEAAEAQAVLASQAGTSLVPIGESAPAIKERLALNRAGLVKAAEAVEAQAESVRMSIRRQQAELEQKMRAQLALLEPMQEAIKLAEEGIHAANLYLGTEEAYERIRDGEPAPADTPVVLRQTVLYMDEECAIASEDGGIDAEDLAAFDEWLLRDPAHLEQVLPEKKGVVVLQTRRNSDGRYDSPWEQAAKEAANSHSWWLIRNGEQVFWMDTNFEVGARLIPSTDEFTSFFQVREQIPNTWPYEYATRQLRPGTDEWAKAEKAAGARQRHFMKVALVLQGLVDRTTVLRPLPAEGLDLLTPASYDSGAVRVVTDDERAIGTGREPFPAWLARKNHDLRVGMRIIGDFTTRVAREECAPTRYERSNGFYGGRWTPREASAPESHVLHTLEATEGEMLVFKYERTDLRYGRERPDDRWNQGDWGDWPYKNRASCRVARNDSWIIPFDLVTVEEMEDYLGARTERLHYATMLPLLKAAIAAKHAEAELEEPMRQMLAGALVQQNGVTIAEAVEAVPELVGWYKLANRWHRPLVTDDPAELAKATRMIVAEHAAILGADVDHAAEAKMLAKLRTQHPDALLIARTRDGYYLSFTAEEDGPYVSELRTSPTGRSQKTTRWQLIGNRWRKWRVLHTSKAWDTWDFLARPTDFMTGPERDAFFAEIVDTYGTYTTGRNDDQTWRLLRIWTVSPVRHCRERIWAEFVDASFNTVIPKLLLSDPIEEPHCASWDHTWHRVKGQVELDIKYPPPVPNRHLASPEQMRSWSGGYREEPPAELVWENEALLAEVQAQQKLVEEANAIAGGLRQRAQRVEAAVAKLWESEAEDVVYRKFLADYVDVDLWEGHKKTITLPKYPHRGVVGELAAGLIERGFQVPAGTVADLVDTYVQLVGPLDGAQRMRANRWGDDTIDAIVVPEEILALSIEG